MAASNITKPLYSRRPEATWLLESHLDEAPEVTKKALETEKAVRKCAEKERQINVSEPLKGLHSICCLIYSIASLSTSH